MSLPTFVHDEGLRALTLHDVVPAGHIALPVLHRRWEPHIHAGEFAILDVSDTEPQLGELYGLTIQSPSHACGHVIKIIQPCRTRFGTPEGCVWFRFGQHRPDTLSYVEGPLSPEGWTLKCRGRVVGILQPTSFERSPA